MKKILLVTLVMLSINAMSQIEVKQGSFRMIEGNFVVVDKENYVDNNNKAMALIKISTENINAEERAKLRFKGNRETDFRIDNRYSEMYLYITASAATFIEIHHPDYGKTEFRFPPEGLCDYCGYEMVVVYKPIISDDKDKAPQNTYLNVVSDQTDAMIYIDGEFVGRGEGSKSLKIGGTHTYKIECDMYHTETDSVTLDSEETAVVEKKMRPAYGFLNITSYPVNDAVVFVDNKNVGTTPYTSDRIPSGTYKVRLVKEMYKTTEQEIVVTDGNTTKAEIVMPANFVNVSIETDPQSDIYLNNEFKAKGSWNGRLVEGSYFIEAKKESHKTMSRNINVTLGKDLNIKIDNPQPIYGFLDVTTSPSRAEIYIDNKLVGQTPKIVNNILIGYHELRIEKEGCAPIRRNIEIKKGETLCVNEKLQTGKEITISTGQNDDKIYIDGNYVGTSPLTTNVSYGNHELKAERGTQTTDKNIEVKINGGENNFVLVFGKLVEITSNQTGNDIYVDGRKVGQTSMKVDLSLGKHEIEVRRGKLYETKSVDVTSSSSSYHFIPKKESLDKYLSRGINFVTLNFAYSSAPQTSFGLTYGQVKKFGWFVSAMSNFDFRFSGNNWNDILLEDNITFSGKSSVARISLTTGIICKIFGPVYFRVGAGYGARVKFWEVGDIMYEYPEDTYKGLDLILGLQFNFKGFVLSTDVVTTNFETMELKVGMGINWKKHRNDSKN